ncbi:hypothetical protein LTR66_002400 [Elasticomyces elasticus]|nr:hypothetical protein LTR50_000453 [Elasticomyces elasticus]KAK4998355.1 hypothetical protein LTR66_002400 [Elasticomyces elasticus]
MTSRAPTSFGSYLLNSEKASNSSSVQRYLREPSRSLFESQAVRSEPTAVSVAGTGVDKCLEAEQQWSQYRFPSPADSSWSSSNNSSYTSKWNNGMQRDQYHADFAAFSSPRLTNPERFAEPFGVFKAPARNHFFPDGSCIAPRKVQQYPDPEPELFTGQPQYIPYENETMAYHPQMNLGGPTDTSIVCHDWHGDTRRDGQSVEPIIKTEDAVSESSIVSPRAQQRRRNRPEQSVNSGPMSAPASKVVKQTSHSRCHSSSSSRSASQVKLALSHLKPRHASPPPSPVRPFTCPLAPYGCPSSFGSKNEWKRHVNTQHVRLGFWRCDLCPSTDDRPNDFNRKDLFIQHLRRMHPTAASSPPKPQITTTATTTTSNPKSNSKPTKRAPPSPNRASEPDPALTKLAALSFHPLRGPPAYSSCLFCPKRFDDWDERLEHVGRHMEKNKRAQAEVLDWRGWRVDAEVEEWLRGQGLLVREGGRWRVCDGRRVVC